MKDIVDKIEKYNKKIELLERNKTKLEAEIEIKKKDALDKKNEILQLAEVDTIDEAKEKLKLMEEQIQKEVESIEQKIDAFFQKYNEMVG